MYYIVSVLYLKLASMILFVVLNIWRDTYISKWIKLVEDWHKSFLSDS